MGGFAHVLAYKSPKPPFFAQKYLTRYTHEMFFEEYTNFQAHFLRHCRVIVPDRRRRVLPEVVFVRHWAIGVLGIWRGEGFGKGLGQGRSVYKQPETEVDGSCHS